MSAQAEALFGLGVLLIGWLLGRWAAKYDVRSWITDAIWRFFWRRGWRDMRTSKIDQALDRDGEFKRQVKSSADAFNADAARWGRAGAAAKHGLLFSIASAASTIAGLLLLIGLVLLAHAGYRLLS